MRFGHLWESCRFLGALCVTLALSAIASSAFLSRPEAMEARPAKYRAPLQDVLAPANVRVAPFLAKGDGRSDDTAAIQAAIDQSSIIFIPRGVYRINPRTGLRVRTGTQLIGEGRAATILLAMPGGGNLQQLANYGPGSLIRRDFDSKGPNSYISYVRLADFSVVMTHPRDAITASSIQIGIDFRNITRSLIERVHVGNLLPNSAPFKKESGHVFDSQGYGIVLGSVPSSLRAYAGGELNVIRDSNIWGAFKGVVQDDELLSPRSAAHGTVIERADIQGAQYLLTQESIYARAFVWRDNVLQNVVPQPGGNSEATVLRIEGQDAKVDGGYIEAGGLARYLVRLGRSTERIRLDLLHVTCTAPMVQVDGGRRNAIDVGEWCRTSGEQD